MRAKAFPSALSCVFVVKEKDRLEHLGPVKPSTCTRKKSVPCAKERAIPNQARATFLVLPARAREHWVLLDLVFPVIHISGACAPTVKEKDTKKIKRVAYTIEKLLRFIIKIPFSSLKA